MINLADKENVFVNVKVRYIFQLSHENKFTVPLISIFLFKCAAWIPPLLRSPKTVLIREGGRGGYPLTYLYQLKLVLVLSLATCEDLMMDYLYEETSCLLNVPNSSHLCNLLLSVGWFTKKVQTTMIY